MSVNGGGFVSSTERVRIVAQAVEAGRESGKAVREVGSVPLGVGMGELPIQRDCLPKVVVRFDAAAIQSARAGVKVCGQFWEMRIRIGAAELPVNRLGVVRSRDRLVVATEGGPPDRQQRQSGRQRPAVAM